jgi:DNA-binding response OmpR family regulator
VGDELLLLDATAGADLTLSEQLAERGFRIRVAWDLDEALSALSEETRPAVLVRAEDGCALEWCQSLRFLYGGPLLVLCSQRDEATAVQYLEAGADTFLGEPISRRELAARIRCHLRQAARAASSWSVAGERRIGDLVVDARARVASRAGRALSLTPTEFRLLAALAQRAGRVAPREELLAEVWGAEHGKRDDVLRIYIGYLRQKLGDDAGEPRLVLNQRGVGYRLTAGGEESTRGHVAAGA